MTIKLVNRGQAYHLEREIMDEAFDAGFKAKTSPFDLWIPVCRRYAQLIELSNVLRTANLGVIVNNWPAIENSENVYISSPWRFITVTKTDSVIPLEEYRFQIIDTNGLVVAE